VTLDKAPIKGFINKKYIEPGSILTGMPASAMFDIVNVSKLKLKVTVNETQVASLKQEACYCFCKCFQIKYLLVIIFIAAKADESLNFAVEIANSTDNNLKAGMYGTANFGSKQTQELKVVPRNAL
jgi:hypothetical protein